MAVFIILLDTVFLWGYAIHKNGIARIYAKGAGVDNFG